MLNRIITLSTLALLCTPNAYAQIANGDFEQWNGNTPINWTTIDSGISVSPTSAQVKTGGLAAKIDVNTGTQGSTDFLQTVTVEQGKTYDFSVVIVNCSSSGFF